MAIRRTLHRFNRPAVAWRTASGPLWPGLLRYGRLGLNLLDFAIGLGRKVGGFAALLTLGWMYFQLLALGMSLHAMFPTAADPELRQTLWVALLLILAQGWDIPTDRLAADWQRLRRAWPAGGVARPVRSAPRWGAVIRVPRRLAEPVVVRLGRFMDLCVSIANKVGALAALVVLAVLACRLVGGTRPGDMYPGAHDPTTSLLAETCVGVVVLGWWAMPFEQIAIFWRRLRGLDEPPSL